MFDYRLKMGKESRVADAVRAFNDCGIQPARRVLVLKRSDLGKVAERVKEFIGE